MVVSGSHTHFDMMVVHGPLNFMYKNKIIANWPHFAPISVSLIGL